MIHGYLGDERRVTIKCKHNKELSRLRCTIFLGGVMQENASVIREGQSLQGIALIVPIGNRSLPMSHVSLGWEWGKVFH